MGLKDKIKDAVGRVFETQTDVTQYIPTEEESKIAERVTYYKAIAIANRSSSLDELNESIEDIWDDEYKMMKGGGLQWKTGMAYRTEKGRKIRPNSEDNFIFNSVQNIVSNITASTPDLRVSGVKDEDSDIAQQLTYASRFNDQRNKFPQIWKQQVETFVAYGPIIGMQVWDPDWQGGSGPDRWIGDVRTIAVDRRDFLPDPAIIDLAQNLQDCEFIIRRIRMKVDKVRKMNEEVGPSISPESSEIEQHDEGSDPQQTNVYECWHKGLPWQMTKDMKSAIQEEAVTHMERGDMYRYQDYMDMADEKMDGIHVAYIANGLLIKYIPYIYDDGLYPFVYKVRYRDENTQHGFGEIRNIKIPQVLHNKADEIEIEAAARQGLGGMYYPTGAVTQKQLENIKQHSGKGAVWLEVTNTNQLRDREPVQVPASIREYKDHKQRMIETVSNVTPIQQGMSPSANMPYAAIKELGSRTDVRLKAAVEILEDYLIEMNKLRINRFAQFYTEERYYRIKNEKGETVEGTIKRQDMMRDWTREQIVDPITGQMVERKEFFVPEFDVTVKVLDEKPTDRNYYTSTAFQLFQMGLMLPEDVWYTLEEGKWPPKDEILERLQMRDVVQGMIAGLQTLPPEMQQAYTGIMQESLQDLQGQAMAQQPQQGQKQKPQQPNQQQQAPVKGPALQ
jgi:hypothetical protein